MATLMNQLAFNRDCMIEQWKLIERQYLVSSHGRVKSLKTGNIMCPLNTGTGYYQIQLRNNGSTKRFKIHRLVASAFIPNPENKPEVNHIDGNPINNIVSNLEWATRSENVKHAYDTGLNNKIRPVVCLNLNGDVVKSYRSAREAEKDGYSNQLISKCCSGKRKTHKRRMWRYA